MIKNTIPHQERLQKKKKKNQACKPQRAILLPVVSSYSTKVLYNCYQ